MPTLDEINGVAVRTPIRMNLDAYAQALNKIDQRDLQARQITSQINAGLSDLYSKLNVADHPWLQSYIDDINKQIDDAASYGNYANALNTAVDLAGKASNNPELYARIKANEDYQNQLKEIQARADSGQISQITRDRWIAQNPYEFDETTQKLKQYDTPISNINFDKIFSNLNALTLSQTTKRDITEYVDEDGNLTNEFLLDYSNVITTQEYSQIRTRKALQDNFNTLIQNNPDAYAALMQDYNDVQWKINQLDNQILKTSDAAKKEQLRSYRNELYNSITKNGQYMSAAEYLESRSKSVIDNLVINNKQTDISLKSSKSSSTNNNGKQLTPEEINEGLGLNASGKSKTGTMTVSGNTEDNGQSDLNACSNIANNL